ncbi:cation:proton antiporter [Enterococcus sp. CSURQ0835]|uniref:cation:proton antiporter n=1 Tax=Enterococcus sp. CSURQ0835 TaxID=2681394 RepID=UPI001359183E|nr:sodium:proton antiporter [Enterococcus sp. CSURQ0835]
MDLIEIIVILAVVITLSNILAKALPAVPIFMIQIILGILLGLTHVGSSITFEPEIFLVMIIAPLLFREGETADIPAILQHFGMILFLAFVGVILTLVGMGFALHAFMPTIPLAACLAFGASLGPTDAVAVGSLAKRLKIPDSVMHVLEGEGLLNDASGVTAFQFAVATLLTGQFSLAEASSRLVISSLGGVALGFLVAYIKRQVIKLIEQISARDITAYFLIGLLLPFLAYLLAEVFHFSGIIAAVVAGVMQANKFRKISLFDARLSNVTETTWQTIGFTLNALVFLFLGIELSQVFSPIWNSRAYSNLQMFTIVIVLTLLLFVIRFVFVSLFFFVRKGFSQTKKQLKERLILTIGGVKGTVSIATIFILPTTINGIEFRERSLLLFITACVTFLSLIIGMIVLPILSDGEVIPPGSPKLMEIFQSVIANLEEDLKNPDLSEKEQLALQSVITNYQNRIQELFNETMPESSQQEFQEIQASMISIERDGLDESFRKRQINVESYRLYSRFIAKFQDSVKRQVLSFLGFWLIVGTRLVRVILHPKMYWQRRQNREDIVDSRDLTAVHEVFLRNSRAILESLENLRDVYDEELIDFFVAERKNLMEQVSTRGLFGTILIQQDPLYTKELIRGYYLERKIIDEYEEADQITTFSANEYRHRVNLLESYAMQQPTEPSIRYAWRKKRQHKNK